MIQCSLYLQSLALVHSCRSYLTIVITRIWLALADRQTWENDSQDREWCAIGNKMAYYTDGTNALSKTLKILLKVIGTILWHRNVPYEMEWIYIQTVNRLWAIDANRRRLRNVWQLMPNGVKADFYPFFVHSARLLRSTSGLWLAADHHYWVMASGRAGSN